MKATDRAEGRRVGALSDAHKAALAEGREQGQVVRRYLEAVQVRQARKGRGRSVEAIRGRLKAVEAKIAGSPPILRLQLLQERLNLMDQLKASDSSDELRSLEDAFVQCVRSYSERKGISYEAWREIGVGAPVLRRADIRARP
jgi:hypothetical protein